MGKPADRDRSYMRSEHGTTGLVTDYGAMEGVRERISRYREAIDRLRDHSSIRNADDYDDWTYGTEPIPGDNTWSRRDG